MHKIFIKIIIFHFTQAVYFVRCILPNNERKLDKFDEELVLQKLKYSHHVPLTKLIDECKSLEKLQNIFKDFHTKVLLFIGFQRQDFKIGIDTIFFRSNKSDLLEQFIASAMAAKNVTKKNSGQR